MSRKLLCLLLLIAGDLLAVLGALRLGPVWGQVWPSSGGAMEAAWLEAVLPAPGGAMDAAWLEAVLPALWLAVLAKEGLYVRRNRLAAEMRHLARAGGVAIVLLIAFTPMLGSLDRPHAASLAWTGLQVTVAVAIARVLVKPALFRLGLWRKEVVLIGAGPTGRRVIDALADDRFTGLEIVCALDDAPALEGTRVRGIPVVGPLSGLEALLQAPGAVTRDLLVAIPSLPRERLQALIARAEGRVESIRFVPDLLGLSTLGVELESLRGTPAIRLKQNLLKPWNALVKRSMDVALAALFSLALLPVWAVLALLVALETPGAPVLVQERIGRRGRRFACLKLRTMYVDAEARLATVLADDASLRGEWEAYAKLRGRDPRVTPIGRWLRRFSLDELPQLWNVLRGDMSLIGPRPYLPREEVRIGDRFTVIGAVRPGLTGLWQVSGRNELTFQERLELDEFYVRNWTVGMDVWILVRTVGVMLTGRGAY